MTIDRRVRLAIETTVQNAQPVPRNLYVGKEEKKAIDTYVTSVLGLIGRKSKHYGCTEFMGLQVVSVEEKAFLDVN